MVKFCGQDFPVSDFYGNFALQLAELILQILTRKRVISSSPQVTEKSQLEFKPSNRCTNLKGQYFHNIPIPLPHSLRAASSKIYVLIFASVLRIFDCETI